MKVLEITPLNQETDNPSWRVKLEGTDKPLWIFKQKPQFVAGYDVPDDKIKLSSKGSSYIWSYKAGYKQTEPKQEQSDQPKQDKVFARPARPPSETHSIECQTKMNNAREIYNHCTDGGTPFDPALLLQIYQSIANIMRNDGALISEIKKEGGVEE